MTFENFWKARSTKNHDEQLRLLRNLAKTAGKEKCTYISGQLTSGLRQLIATTLGKSAAPRSIAGLRMDVNVAEMRFARDVCRVNESGESVIAPFELDMHFPLLTTPGPNK